MAFTLIHGCLSMLFCFAHGTREKLFGKFRLIDADEFFAEAEAEEQHVLEMERERCFDGTEIE